MSQKANANAAFKDVRQNSVALWVALVRSGVRPPFEGSIDTWIGLDRRREEQMRLVKESVDPTVRKCERDYQRALNHLMKEIDGLVWLYARRMAKFAAKVSLEVEDLVQEGFLGVMRAVETFEPERGHVFNTYAHFWIYRGMRKALQNAGIIRLPSSAKSEDVKRLRKASYLEDINKNGRPRKPGSGEADYNTPSLSESLEDPGILSDEILINEQDDRILVELLAQLALQDQKKFDVLIARFYGERTFAQIGEEYGVCRERVRQINDAAIEKLQQFAKDKGKHGLH